MNRCLSVLILMILLAASASADQLLKATDLNIYIKGAGLPNPAQEYMIYPDINAEVPLHEGLPVVRQGMSIRLDFNLTSFGTDAVDNRRMLILTQTQLTRQGFPDVNLCWTISGWASIGGGTYKNLRTTHSFIPLNHSDNNAGFTVTGSGGDHNSWHWNLNFPVVVEHIGEWQNGISNVAGGKHSVYIATFTPDVANTARQHAVVPVWLDNEDYEILVPPPAVLPTELRPTQDVYVFPVGGYRIIIPIRDRAASDKLGCSTPGTDTIPHCGEACVSLWVPVADCFRNPDTNGCIVEAGPPAKIVPEKGVSKYTPNINVANANPYKAFDGSIKVRGSCEGSYPWQWMGPKSITIPANGAALIDLNSLANAPEQCTIMSNCTQANRQFAYIYNARGQAVPQATDKCSGLEVLGDVGGIYFNSCCQAIITTPRACAWYTTTDPAEAEPIHANKYIYLAGENGTITINWRYLKAWSYIDDVIPQGSYFNVKVYKILDDGSRQQVFEANKVPYPLTTRDVTAADRLVQFKEAIPFQNTTGAPLSTFDINVGMIKPDNITPVGGNAGGSVSDCPLPRVSKTYTAPSFFWKVVRPGYTCAKSIIDRYVNGKPGKAAKFVCTLPTTPIQKESYAIFDFNQNYPIAGLQSNLLEFYAFDGSNKEPLTYVITEDKRTAVGIVFLPLTVDNTGKQYVSELAPDICAKDIIMPGTWPAGIDMQASPWFTNCGFVNIGATTPNEGLPAVPVKIDYGDGTAPQTTAQSYSAATGAAILADAAYAFLSIGTYSITATADPGTGAAFSGSDYATALFAAGDLIAEGDESNNEVSGDVTIRPACSTVFCDNSFTEEAAPGSGPNCAPCDTVPGYTCADPANYVCFNGNTSLGCGGDGSALPGCDLCAECIDNSDCASGICDEGVGVCVASASAGPSAALSATKSTQTLVDFTYECKDPQAGGGGCTATPGCITSCTLDVDTAAPEEGSFGVANPESGDAIVSGAFTHDYATLGLGTYTATLTTTTCTGQTATKTYTVQIGDNRWPTAEIITPVNGAAFNEGTPVTLTGRGSDAEDKPSDLDYAWKIDGSAVLPSDKLMPAGTNVAGEWGTAAPFNTTTLTPGAHTITLEVTDQGLPSAPPEPPATGSASVTVEIIPALGDVSVKSLNYSTVISKGTSGTFKAVIANTNTEAKSVNVTLSISGPNSYAYACPVQTVPISASGTADVSCDAGPFDALGSYAFKAKINSCSALPCNRLASNDVKSGYFTVIQTQAISVPELPLVFAALAALAVVALLNRRR